LALTYEQFQKLDKEGFTPEEIASFETKRTSGTTQQPNKPQKPENAFMSYLKNAQPAFKYAVTGDLGKTEKPWSDIYRETRYPGGGTLPFAKSTSTAGQMVPQVLGGALDIGTRPSSYIGAYAAPRLLAGGGKMLANNPATRRWLQVHTPTLSKGLLTKNPVSPIMKNIDDMQVDITKPLPKKSEFLTNKTRDIVKSVDNTFDSVKNEYGNLLKPHAKNIIPKKQINAIGISDDVIKQLEKYDIDLSNIDSVEKAWDARHGLRKLINDPWKKAELYKSTSFKEDTVTNIMKRLKAVVLNNVDKPTRKQLLMLDPKYEIISKAGGGIKSALYNPKTGRYNTKTIVDIYKNPNNSGTRDLFRKFEYYDKNVGSITKEIKAYNTRQTMKKWGGGIIGLGAVDQFIRWKMRKGMDKATGGGGRDF